MAANFNTMIDLTGDDAAPTKRGTYGSRNFIHKGSPKQRHIVLNNKSKSKFKSRQNSSKPFLSKVRNIVASFKSNSPSPSPHRFQPPPGGFPARSHAASYSTPHKFHKASTKNVRSTPVTPTTPKAIVLCSCGSRFDSEQVYTSHWQWWVQQGDSTHTRQADIGHIGAHIREGKKTTTPTSIVPTRAKTWRASKRSHASLLIQTVEEMDASTNYPQTYALLPPLSNMTLLPIEVDPVTSVLLLYEVEYVVFVDLDNVSMCQVNTECPRTLVWAFFGDQLPQKHKSYWKDSFHLATLCTQRRLWLTRCGPGKNSADFGISFQASQLHMLLPMDVPFAVVSNDGDHIHTVKHLLNSPRTVALVTTQNHNTSLPDIIKLLSDMQQNGGTTNNIANRVTLTAASTETTVTSSSAIVIDQPDDEADFTNNNNNNTSTNNYNDNNQSNTTTTTTTTTQMLDLDLNLAVDD